MPFLTDLSSESDMGDLVDPKVAVDIISRLLIDNSLSLASSDLSRRKKSSKKRRCVKLLDDIKAAHSVCKTAFISWKKHDFPIDGGTHDTSHRTRNEF